MDSYKVDVFLLSSMVLFINDYDFGIMHVGAAIPTVCNNTHICGSK